MDSSRREDVLLRRQKLLADFGELALQSEDLDEVLGEACRLVAGALETGRAKVLEIEEGGKQLLVRAGVGWGSEVVGQARVPMSERSSESFSIKERKPVISRDIEEDTRFEVPAFMRKAGVRAMANVPIFLPGNKAFGLLQVDDTKPRDFDQDDTHFLRTYATILGPVIDRIFKVHRLEAVEEHQRQRDIRFRSIFEAAPVGLSLLSAEGKFLRVNKELERILGRSQEELASLGVADVTHPHDVEPSTDAMRRAVEDGETASLDKRYVQPSGKLVHANSSLIRLPGDRGSTNVLAVTADLTLRRQAEEALRRSEERHRLILESALDYAIFTIDDQGRIIDWPLGAQAVFGGTAKEMIGQNFAVTFTPEDRAAGVPQKELEEARDKGYAPNVRWHRRRDGARVFIEGSTWRLAAESVRSKDLLKIGRDVTLRKEWEERQVVLIAELQHRTRNLMGVVRSMADRTMRRSADLADFRLRFKDRLDALARVQGLLSRLTDWSRITFDELIETEIEALSGEAERVTLDGPPGIQLRSSTVQTLAMALHELATNAMKYGAFRQIGGHLTVRWHLEQENGAPWLHVDWRETGVTMPAAGSSAEGSGMGRELIERALPHQLGAKTTFVMGEDGIHCTIALPVSERTMREGAPDA